jgi:AraC-like DNA-binding protein
MTASGDWVRRFARPDAIKVLALAHGACWLEMEDVGQPVRLKTGDVIIVNGRHALMLMSDPALRHRAENTPVPVESDITRLDAKAEVQLLGGHVAVDVDQQNLLLDVLPPLIQIDGASEEAGILRWLLGQLARELATDRPGASTAAAQLAQLIFVEALRAYLRQPGPGTPGWLRGLGDARIAPALALLHREPHRPWTLAELAKAVGMSRTSFAERFKALVGVAPLTYLAGWRMQLAARTLRRSELPIAVLARQYGYRSESAFSNAFKRVTGVAPRTYRAANRRAVPSLSTTEEISGF